jgi:biotin synthase
MCYAIPGKVVDISGRTATVDYFGERRKAYVDLLEGVTVGDNVYAQGGFLIRKISQHEADEVLKIWEDIFFKLKEQDKKLAHNPKNLYERANAVRQKHQDNSCCVHGIIEFSNFCRCDCLYCGIRHSNENIRRYRMEIPEILLAVDEAVSHGFQALVLQSGEDPYYTDDKLVEIVRQIRARHPVLIFVSVGERSTDVYKRLYDAGARGVLLRFETSNPDIYKKLKPASNMDERLSLIRRTKEMGYLVATGFLIGLPGQKHDDIMRDIKMTADLGAEMFSFGPFIPHPQTPLAGEKSPPRKKVLDTIANARIMNPDAKILVTTALETLWGLDGAKSGLMAGANSLMINVTPEKYRLLYDIYPERFGTKIRIEKHIDMVIDLLRSIGRAPTDLSV